MNRSPARRAYVLVWTIASVLLALLLAFALAEGIHRWWGFRVGMAPVVTLLGLVLAISALGFGGPRVCPRCRQAMTRQGNYCPRCGRALK